MNASSERWKEITRCEGLYWVEINSRPGILESDASAWTTRRDGGIYTSDNPRLLANRKAKQLESFLARHPVFRQGRVHVLFLDAHILLSHEEIGCRLSGHLGEKVLLRDKDSADQPREDTRGVIASLRPPYRVSGPRPCGAPRSVVSARRYMSECRIVHSPRSRDLNRKQQEFTVVQAPHIARSNARDS